MAIILASIQICNPLFFGFEHSACQLGTVAVFKPFPNPVDVRLRPDGSKRKIGYIPVTIRPMTNWCPARCFILRLDTREKPEEVDMIRTPGTEVIWIIVPIVTKKAPTTCHAAARDRDFGTNVPMYMFFLLPTSRRLQLFTYKFYVYHNC